MIDVITESENGFPIIDGYRLDSNVRCLSSGCVLLRLHQHSPDYRSIINVQLILIDACMLSANVELNPHFPDVASYSILPNDAQKGVSTLTINFDRGNLVFSYRRSMYVKSSQPLGSLPNALKQKLMDNN